MGLSSNRMGKIDMSAKVQWVTGFIAVLMLAAAFMIRAGGEKSEAAANKEPRAQEYSHDVHFY
jgi:hypothetical protein